MSLTLHYAARSDRGLIREANEDSVYAGPRLLAVADGMGGMAAGEVASNIVIAALAPLDDDAPSADLADALRSAIENANEQLREAVSDNPALEGMGTTLTAALFTGNRIALVHVGDSRAYIWRDEELAQITRDDTYVQMLVDEGRISPEEAHTHPQRSLLTRALDGREVEPDFSIREAHAGDRYLLCSDGLSGVVSAETISEALQLEDPGAAADRLVQLALRGGGPDNVTCIVADIVADDAGTDAPVVGGAAAHDRGRSTAAGDDSAAGRAMLAAQTEAASSTDDNDEAAAGDTDTETEPAGRRRRRLLLVGLGVVGVVALTAAFVGWRYTQQQYYVGATDDGSVAIYRGVEGSVGGLTFSSVVEKTTLKVDELPPLTRDDVESTIWAGSRHDAEEKVERLRRRQLPRCETLNTPSPSPTTAPTPSSTVDPNADPNASPTPVAETPAATESPSPQPTKRAEPGVNCREAGGGGAAGDQGAV